MAGLSLTRDPADRWLGVGVGFPFYPVPPDREAVGLRSMATVRGMALVRQSIETILDTEPGERVMLPDFGCGLRRYLMAPNTAATRTAIQRDISDALARWEPRIRLTEVTVSPSDDPALVYIDISYARLPDLRPDNLVYPFYLA